MENQAWDQMSIELVEMKKLIYLHDTTSTIDNGSQAVNTTGRNDSSQQLLIRRCNESSWTDSEV